MNINDIALSMQDGIGVKGVVHLLSVFGNADNIYAASLQELISQAELREDLAKGIVKKTAHSQAESELKYCVRNNIKAVASTDEEYPAMLREISDFPHILYVKGSTDSFARRMVSVVGTRASTQYGLRMCEVLIGRLGELCPDAVVVSGLAFGIDAASHRAALGAGLATIAVLPSILPEIAPSQNESLANEIIANGGAIISELNSHTKQNGKYYIPRNRIMAGLSDGTILVESLLKGGSLSTAEFAYGYDRALMAVPGRASDKCSEGTNALIRAHRATMVCTGDDIVRELNWNNTATAKALKSVVLPNLSQAEQHIISCFTQGETIGLDELSVASNTSIGELTAILLGLELSDIVRPLPGKVYELTI